MRSRRIL